MGLLSKLSPAEIYLILEASKADLKTLIKFTLLDLLHKKVLKISQVRKQRHKNDPVKTYNYVVTGEKFSQYTASMHEKIFSSPFMKRQSIRILFRQMVKIGFESAGSKKEFIHERLIKSPDVQNYFKQSFFHLLFGYLQLTDKGRKAKIEIETTISELEKELLKAQETDQRKALEIISSLGSNILLVRNFDYAGLKQVDKKLLEEFQKHNKQPLSTLFDYDYWDEYETYRDFFDSSFDSIELSSFDSGCGGCEGCS